MTKSGRVLLWVVVGSFVWVPLILANNALGRPSNSAWSLWYWVGYPVFLAFAFVSGHRTGRASWPDSILLMSASYVTALIFVEHTGNLLPFELLLMTILTIPLYFAERSGGNLRGSDADKSQR